MLVDITELTDITISEDTIENTSDTSVVILDQIIAPQIQRV